MNNIALIDGDSVIYLSTYNKEGNEKSIGDIFACVDRYISDILLKTKSEHYAGFLTNGSFRYDIATLKPYKGNRLGLAKPKYFKLVEAYMIEEYGFVKIKNYEADDLCIMAHKTYTINGEFNPIIATPDKDLKQIKSTFYDYKKGELVELPEQEAYRNLWKQVLTGDSSDNIPGVKGCGEVKANKILLNANQSYPLEVLKTYMETYGEHNGILNFTENYRLVKMLDTLDEDLFIPSVVEKKVEEKDGWLD